MKPLITLLVLAALPFGASAQSTANSTNHHAWAANTGWIDFRAERPAPGDGFKFGDFSCSGYLWSPTIGWINCGDGNTSFGVSHNGAGDLSGHAWSANTGWINFGWWTSTPTNSSRPRVDLLTGEFSGYAWSPNCGWINLGTGLLKTDRMEVVDVDGDGISDVYEMNYAGDLTSMDGTSDLNLDGVGDRQAYLNGDSPFATKPPFRITRLSKIPNVNAVELEWPSSPARVYAIEAKPDLTQTNWLLLGTVNGSAGTNTVQAVEMGAPAAFFRIGVKLPLQP